MSSEAKVGINFNGSLHQQEQPIKSMDKTFKGKQQLAEILILQLRTIFPRSMHCSLLRTGATSPTVKDIQNRHFIDDVYVIDSGIAAQTGTASITLKLLPKEYSHLEDSTYVIGLDDYNITVNPDLTDLAGVKIGAVTLLRDVDYTVSGNVLKINKESFTRNNIVPGKYTVRLDLYPAEITFELNIVPLEVRDYYLSNNGDDHADGRTPATAWKSISKINEYVFILRFNYLSGCE